jgi:type I restriction enzyme M protein
MLNAETKRKIKNARDVLVGKIPVPTAQVEQITLALMFKFMGDMDERAEKLGDKTGFFQGEYSKYSWRKIMDKTVSADTRVNLYSEALEKMNTNPNVPQLFRDIFKGAFLPFRDPETLKLFLAEINEIEYTHSEDLGDAYEHLLSVMGSQGDAGQFRTPRHIIDFIVEVVDPKKEDRVLDPACGTAGFLISAYKHILKNNTTKDSKTLGDALSPMDRRKLTKNFVGYDISHEMRRLSLVNMYLHQFPDPQIYEYDTLTSLDHWDEDFDCILANPPFMTPKGGIRPHSRYSIKSKRAEVLFVDYIMSHLSTTGKAGIIVPEGIIFQSSNAYKNLRKLLVEDNYLWAVVSLPAGVFQPYSGVKTSVLLLDKNIAKKTDKILFVNVDNDGFDLGAQRKEIEENDLPKVLESLKKYKESVLEEKEIEEEELFNTHVVEKSKIKESGDYNLSGNRYQSSERGIYVKGKWEKDKLKNHIKFLKKSKRRSGDGMEEGKYNFFVSSQSLIKRFDIADYPEEALILGTGGSPSVHISKEFSCSADTFVIKSASEKLDNKFLYYLLRFKEDLLSKGFRGGGLKHLSKEYLKNLSVPLPPIEEQKKIVEEIDRYQRIIDGARMVIDNWKPEIEFGGEWKPFLLGNLCTFEYGYSVAAKDSGEYRFIRITDIGEDGYIKDSDSKYVDLNDKSSKYILNKGDVVVARTGATYGKAAYFDKDYDAVFAGYLIRLHFNEDVIPKYFWIFSRTEYYQQQKESLVQGGGQPQFNANSMSKMRVPLPTIEEQRNIINETNTLEELIKKNNEIVRVFQERSSKIISRIFNE